MTKENVVLTARDKILLKAHELFYRDGIRATGIDRIIKESGVTKVTFYRHYPSKDDLILAYLEYRHTYWMAWFTEAVERHRRDSGDIQKVILGVLAEWFDSQVFRGCAFINAMVEFDSDLPRLREIIQGHKAEMGDALIAQLRGTALDGQALAVAMAIDGAIVKAQIDGQSALALKGLREILAALGNQQQPGK
jgi:AcrR family transcriptional regulator